ncbi:MAG: hypothetical protein F6J97_12185 [Leptolyngbya sp. SIO4C1]|nr:hypothetical protein [Leptolyngbya sp. SIO4C1]
MTAQLQTETDAIAAYFEREQETGPRHEYLMIDLVSDLCRALCEDGRASVTAVGIWGCAIATLA